MFESASAESPLILLYSLRLNDKHTFKLAHHNFSEVFTSHIRVFELLQNLAGREFLGELMKILGLKLFVSLQVLEN